MIIVLDIDNTLSDMAHREHIIDKKTITKEDWAAFLDPELIAKDPPIKNAQVVLDKLFDLSNTIFLLTGRNELLRTVTEEWLLENYGIIQGDYEALLMRPVDSRSRSSEYKKRILENEVLPYAKALAEPILLFDDDPYVLHMASSLGILAMKAPDCWDVMVHEKPKKKEKVLAK